MDKLDWYGESVFESLKGITLTDIVQVSNEEMIFTTSDLRKFRMHHSQDCCESVSIDEIHGDLQDLIGSPILLAEVVKSNQNPEGVTKDYQESFTWTFYKLATIKGSATIRWYGSSNGFYSELVTFIEIKEHK